MAVIWSIGIASRNEDYVRGYALIIAGALVAIAVTRYAAGRLRREESLADESDWKLGR